MNNNTQQINTELQYKIALTLIPNIGPILIRRLVSYIGGVNAIFEEKKPLLEKVPGIGQGRLNTFDKKNILEKAEQELKYIEKNKVKAYFYLDDAYPKRLKECEDAPIVLFSKGNVNYNSDKILSVVGTRRMSEYGEDRTKEIIDELSSGFPDIIIVSGLAYGVDIAAHNAALANGVKTVAVLAHGFNHLYPPKHKKQANEIIEQGALATEFFSRKMPDPGNFVSRNRIVAGLSDATLVIESAEKGGALITADLANSYNRDVFAIPGRSIDTYSRGCNALIRDHKALLVENGNDIQKFMRWMPNKEKNKAVQKQLFDPLDPDEEKVLSVLPESESIFIDQIGQLTRMPVHKLPIILLNLEFKGFIKPLPGKMYRKIG